MKLVAKTFAGLEAVLSKELERLGATKVKQEKRAVSFEADLQVLYKANYELRTALRILKPIHTFEARHPEHIYKHIYAFNWSKYLKTHQTFAIDSTVHSPYFTHSKFVALKMKDAIVDQFRDKTGRRPSVDTKEPDVRMNIRINVDEVTIMLDSSGFNLHKRGYRTSGRQAPINETLAAGLILTSGWQTNTPFIDFMCGSGTFLIEAACLATNTPPGVLRESNYAFENWTDFDESIWAKVKAETKANIKLNESTITGFDIDPKMIALSQQHAKMAGFENTIQIKHSALKDSRPPTSENEEGAQGTIIINPPYGLRLQSKDLQALYKSIGDAFKQNYTGYTAWVFSGSKEALKRLGLRTSKKLSFYNGAVECKFHRYDLY